MAAPDFLPEAMAAPDFLRESIPVFSKVKMKWSLVTTSRTSHLPNL